jgi:signal transduction histidine kinase
MKLLHKTLRVYLAISVVVFAISVPVFYFLVQNLWITDVDESLIYQKRKIVAGLGSYESIPPSVGEFSQIANAFDLGVSIERLEKPVAEKDSIYYNDIFDKVREHQEPFRELRSVVMVSGQFYLIIIRKDLVENKDLIQSIVIAEALIFLILLAGALLLNNYLSKKTWRPFYNLINQLKSFKIDKGLAFKTEKSDIDEFEELNRSVVQLIENNIRVFNSQKEFTENAAHETQTPLAAIKNQIDLFSQSENLSKSQSEIIERIDKNIRFLTKLNRNLLLLSKIENNSFDRSEDVDIHSVLKEVLSIFNEQIDLNGIQLSQKLNDYPIIKSNPFLIHVLLSNLLKNSIKYNLPDGHIEITLSSDALCISNSGGTHALPKHQIFERFYKKSNKAESSGLGLAIAKQICNLLEFELNYEFKGTRTHSFSVIFEKK